MDEKMKRLADAVDITRLDMIASKIKRAETLNAIHACRPDHPMGRGNSYKWRNAYAMVVQLPSFQTPAHRLVEWLREKAEQEAV